MTSGLLVGVARKLLVSMVLAICSWMASLVLHRQNRIENCACGVIIGAALGTVLDQQRHGAMTDFLDPYFGSMYWPAFNLAGALLISSFAILIFLPAIKARRNCAD